MERQNETLKYNNDALTTLFELPPPFFKGGSKFYNYFRWRGEFENLKKWVEGGSMVQGQVLLKGRGRGEGDFLALSVFNFFKVCHFYI